MGDLSEVLRSLATTKANGDGNYSPPEEDSGDDGEVCEICGGHGWTSPNVPVGHPEFGTLVRCQCQESRLEEEHHDRLLKYSNLGHLSRFTFEKLNPDGLSDSEAVKAQFREAHEAARAYADDPQGWLTLVGPNGAGKTHLAAAIANHCIENHRIVFFSHVPDLLDHLRSSFGPASEIAYSELLDQVRTTPLLVLDGLGSQSVTAWAEEKLRQVINHRYNADLPTIVTTAMHLEDLDPYVATRLKTPGLGKVIELGAREPKQLQGLGQIPAQMLSTMTFETFDARGNSSSAEQRSSLEGAYRAAKQFSERPDGWLVLFSHGTGVGKTHLSIAVAERQIREGRQVVYSFVPELVDYLRYTFSPDSRVRYDDAFDRVKNASLLILDDLGRERSNPWAEEKLYQIIVHRHNNRLPTLITSPQDFTNESGPISSRVQDPTISQLIRIDANDYRKKGRPQR
jgi:DNA replication protein DnaC